MSWVNPGARSGSDNGIYTDLAYVFKIVKCPFCGKLIPRKYMDDMLGLSVLQQCCGKWR